MYNFVLLRVQRKIHEIVMHHPRQNNIYFLRLCLYLYIIFPVQYYNNQKQCITLLIYYVQSCVTITSSGWYVEIVTYCPR